MTRHVSFALACTALCVATGAVAAPGSRHHAGTANVRHAGADADHRDLGESAKYEKLKVRSVAPKATAIDASATLENLLAKHEPDGFSSSRGATVEGYAIQSEREEDGDVHLVLATERGETNTRRWVIAEVTPGWQKRDPKLSASRLRKLVGHKLRVTGWLYYEPDVDSDDPRGTRWELHPVTSITVLDAQDHRGR